MGPAIITNNIDNTTRSDYNTLESYLWLEKRQLLRGTRFPDLCIPEIPVMEPPFFTEEVPSLLLRNSLFNSIFLSVCPQVHSMNLIQFL